MATKRELDANDTNALLNEIDELRQRLEEFDRVKARIEKWHTDTGNPFVGVPEAEMVLSKVLSIFKEEISE